MPTSTDRLLESRSTEVPYRPRFSQVVIDVALTPQQLQTQQLVPSEYLEQRAQAVDTVTKTIAELGTMYQQLAVMVAGQGDMLQRIDENVDQARAMMTLMTLSMTLMMTLMMMRRLALAVVVVMLVLLLLLLLVRRHADETPEGE